MPIVFNTVIVGEIQRFVYKLPVIIGAVLTGYAVTI